MSSARSQPQARTKRSWLYTGMAIDPGVALVRHVDRTPRMIVPPAQSADVVLVGADAFARGLAPALGKLVADQGGRLVRPSGASLPKEARPRAMVVAGSTQDVLQWLQQGKRMGLVTLLAPPPGGLDEQMAARARGAGIRVAPTARSSVTLGPDGRTPTASGFAALAGVIWTWLR